MSYIQLTYGNICSIIKIQNIDAHPILPPGRQERSMSLPPGVMSFVITLGNEIDVDSSCMLCCHIEV